MIKIAVVEDDVSYRRYIVDCINKAKDLRCEDSFGEAGSFIRFLESGGEVDILLLDLRLPGRSGLEALEPILNLRDELKIIVLTIYDDNPMIKWAMRMGVRGYLLKSSTESEIMEHIDKVSKGHILYSVAVSRNILKESKADPNRYNLSARELEVLLWLSKGFGNDRISEKLFISKSTVETHLHHIFEKMRVQNRAEAVSKALKEGIVD